MPALWGLRPGNALWSWSNWNFLHLSLSLSLSLLPLSLSLSLSPPLSLSRSLSLSQLQVFLSAFHSLLATLRRSWYSTTEGTRRSVAVIVIPCTYFPPTWFRHNSNFSARLYMPVGDSLLFDKLWNSFGYYQKESERVFTVLGPSVCI